MFRAFAEDLVEFMQDVSHCGVKIMMVFAVLSVASVEFNLAITTAVLLAGTRMMGKPYMQRTARVVKRKVVITGARTKQPDTGSTPQHFVSRTDQWGSDPGGQANVDVRDTAGDHRDDL